MPSLSKHDLGQARRIFGRQLLRRLPRRFAAGGGEDAEAEAVAETGNVLLAALDAQAVAAQGLVEGDGPSQTSVSARTRADTKRSTSKPGSRMQTSASPRSKISQ